MNNRITPAAPLPFLQWEELMNLALQQAELARIQNEVPVGAVVVSAQGEIIGYGHNMPVAHNDPTSHAEIQAIRMACKTVNNYRLDNCILVVTLEPCLMCVGAIVHARIAGVVFGAEDAKAGAVTSCLDGFEQPFLNHTVWHMGRVAETLCKNVLQNFFVNRRF